MAIIPNNPKSGLKLTPERAEKICLAIQQGNAAKNAAIMGGISPRSYHNYMSKGKELEEEFERLQEWEEMTEEEKSARIAAGETEPVMTENEVLIASFALAIKTSEAVAEAIAIKTIRQAAQDGTWQAAAWWLERTKGDRYKVVTEKRVTNKHEHHFIPPDSKEMEEARKELELLEAQAKQLPQGNQDGVIDGEAVELETSEITDSDLPF